jgi:hypothetical protein
MKEFTDKNGKIYSLSITIGSIMRVKSKLDVDLLQIEKGENPLLTRLWEDEVLLAQVIACLLSNQIADKTDEEILESFDGDTILKATTCFYDELIDFFQKSARTERAELVKKQQALIKEVIAKATETLKSQDVSKMVSGIEFGSMPDK